MDLQKGPEEGKRELSYQTTVAAREQDERSHDRYMASRMCQALALACVVWGVGMPVAQCAGLMLFRGLTADAFFSGCVSIVIMLILGAVFRSLAERIGMGGTASVIVATVVGSLGALGSLGLAVGGLIGTVILGEMGSGLVATFSFAVFVFLYGKLLYHCFRVLILRGKNAQFAQSEKTVGALLQETRESMRDRRFSRWAVMGIAAGLLVFNLVYVAISAGWLRQTLALEAKSPMSVTAPPLPPAVLSGEMSLAGDYYDQVRGLSAEDRREVVAYCEAKWGITETQGRLLDWALRERGRDVLGEERRGSEKEALSLRIRGSASDETPCWGPKVDMIFPKGGVRLGEESCRPFVLAGGHVFRDDIVENRFDASEGWRWMMGAVAREVAEMRAEVPGMTDAQAVAVCKRLRDELPGNVVLAAQGSYRANGGLLTVRFCGNAPKAFYVTTDGRVYDRSPEEIAAENLHAKKVWDATVPKRKWELHWSGPLMLLLDGLVGTALAIWTGIGAKGDRSLRNLACFKVAALAFTCAATTWFLVLWCRTDPPYARLILNGSLVAAMMVVVIVRGVEFLLVWQSTVFLVKVPEHTPFVKAEGWPLGVLALGGVVIAGVCIAGAMLMPMPQPVKAPEIPFVRAEPPAVGPSAEGILEMVKSPEAVVRRRGVDEYLVYLANRSGSGNGQQERLDEIRQQISGLAKDYDAEEPSQAKFRAILMDSGAAYELYKRFSLESAARNPKSRATYAYVYRLIRYSERKCEKVLEKLIEAGMPLDGKEWRMEPLLNRALWTRNMDVVKLLLAHKANPNLVDIDGSPVLAIAFQQQMGNDVYQLLLDGGADVNFVPPRGRGTFAGMPVVYMAVSQFRTADVEFFLKHGADPNATFSNRAALDFVIRSKNPEAEKIRKLLLEHGAKTSKEIEASLKKGD